MKHRFCAKQSSVLIRVNLWPMNLARVAAKDFDLEKTIDSGQVFHWQSFGRGFVGAIRDTGAYVEQRGERLLVAGVNAKIARRYFALDHPLPEICRSFPKDETMTAAAEFCRGLRVIRQPKWECLATFICSSMKQVGHIRQISLALRRCFGERIEIDGVEAWTFPSAKSVAALSEEALRRCALGYRAKNLLATARAVANREADVAAWSKLSDDELRSRLCALPGVGAKVANCVMLFAYERLRAFPIDVWIERVLKQKYFPGRRKIPPQKLREFCDSYFGEYGGYAQQYLFHHARMTKRRSSRGRLRKARAALRGC